MKDAFSQTSDSEQNKPTKLFDTNKMPTENKRRRPYDYRRITESILSPITQLSPSTTYDEGTNQSVLIF